MNVVAAINSNNTTIFLYSCSLVGRRYLEPFWQFNLFQQQQQRKKEKLLDET